MKCFNTYAMSMLILVTCATNLPAQVISTDEAEPPRATGSLQNNLPPKLVEEAGTQERQAQPPIGFTEAGPDKPSLRIPPEKPAADTGPWEFGENFPPREFPTDRKATEPTYIIGTNLIVAYSDDKDTIWGFSKVTGKWAKQTINPVPSGKLVPSVAKEVAGLQVSETIYAFSGRTGTWDILRLPKGRKTRIGFDDDVIFVTDGENVYTFPATTGKWSSPSAARGADLEKSPNNGRKSAGYGLEKTEPSGEIQQAFGKPIPDQQIKVFCLTYITVEAAATLIRQMFEPDEVLVAAENRTNSLIVRGSKEALDQVEALLLRIDDNGNAPKKKSESGKSVGPYGAEAYGAGMDDGGSMYSEDLYGRGVADQESLEQLAQQFQNLNLDTAKIASRYRQLRESGKAGRGELQDLKRQLHEGVSAAFGVRQRLQQVELGQLRRELHSIQQTISAREHMKDKIIERRISDLLNPQLRWNADSKQVPAPDEVSTIQPPGQTGTPSVAESKMKESPLKLRRKELEEQRQRIFEDIVSIELLLIESQADSSKNYLKNLSEEDLKRLSDQDKERFEAEAVRMENRMLQSEDRKVALQGELEVVEKQLELLQSRLKDEENDVSIRDKDAKTRFLPPPSNETGVAVLEAKLAAAESELKRAETLYRRGIVTETQFAKAELEVEVLKQQLEDSRSRREAEEQLLVIDLKSAQLEFEAAAEELAQMEKFRSGTTSAASISELARLRLAVGQAELSVQRAQTKLDLLRSQANPKLNGH